MIKIKFNNGKKKTLEQSIITTGISSVQIGLPQANHLRRKTFGLLRRE